MTAGYPREELEEMVRRWAQAGRDAEATGDWAAALTPLYTPEIECRVNIGPDQVYVGRGVDAIAREMLGDDMRGFEGWTYPHERAIIDDRRGEVVIYWRQVSPFKRSDGTPYAVCGFGTSFLRYAGNYRWSYQEDAFDLGQVTALLLELAAEGLLSTALKHRIRKMAWGHQPSGYGRQPHAMSALKKVQAYAAMARIAIAGR